MKIKISTVDCSRVLVTNDNLKVLIKDGKEYGDIDSGFIPGGFEERKKIISQTHYENSSYSDEGEIK